MKQMLHSGMVRFSTLTFLKKEATAFTGCRLNPNQITLAGTTPQTLSLKMRSLSAIALANPRLINLLVQPDVKDIANPVPKIYERHFFIAKY